MTKICRTYIETCALGTIDNQIVRKWAGYLVLHMTELAVIFMRTILTTLILICLTNLTIAQDHSFDTTFKSNKQALHFSIKDLDSNFALLTSTYASRIALHDTIDSRGLASIHFPDFNNDTYADILISYLGNNPTYFLYLFDPITKQFKSIDGYMKYPDAIQLKANSKFYYSYHRAGCADLNWVSDLFKIIDFKIIQVGHIYGQGCNFEVRQNPQVIEIYKVTNNDEGKAKLISKLPYLKYIGHFDNKWDFIKNFWNKNYQKFD